MTADEMTADEDQGYLEYCREAIAEDRSIDETNRRLGLWLIKSAICLAPITALSIFFAWGESVSGVMGEILSPVAGISRVLFANAVIFSYIVYGSYRAAKKKDLSDEEIIAKRCAPYQEWRGSLSPQAQSAYQHERELVVQHLASVN